MAKFTALLIIIVCIALMAPGRASQQGPVWFWFATCGGPAMTVEIRLEKTMLHRSSVPLCRADRASADSQGQASRIEFSFRPARAILWAGYRDTPDGTAADHSIEGNIWQAGADPDALAIGISFVDGSKILTNTVHIAHPGQRDESTIANGLVVLTYPAGR
jgi:hypothetical protein